MSDKEGEGKWRWLANVLPRPFCKFPKDSGITEVNWICLDGHNGSFLCKQA